MSSMNTSRARSSFRLRVDQGEGSDMNMVRKTTCLFIMVLSFACVASATQKTDGERPLNIVFLIADDLGYGDIGPFGQTKIKTPTLDKLASQGMKLTRHYSGNAVCAPSRCVLMTGLHPGHAQIRDNREMKPEGQFPLKPGTRNLARILNENGYATGGFGKWGLGAPDTDGRPVKQGFDRFFGYNCQAKAHNNYPTYLWDNDLKVEIKNPDFPAHQKMKAGADLNNPDNFKRYSGLNYGMDLITDESLKFIEQNRDKPFFLYYPTIVPHLALQVPGDSLGEYQGKLQDSPYDGSRGYLPNYSPHATYAAMVTRMDMSIGRILDKVESLGLTHNTIVVFTSDNGPLYDRLGGTDTGFFQSACDLRGRKGSLYEGGVRVPTIVKLPKKVPQNTTSAQMTGFEDWLPTLLTLAGLKMEIPNGIDGIDFSNILLGQSQLPRPFLYREFPGYGGQQAVWSGKWKAVRQNLIRRERSNPNAVKRIQVTANTMKTELYDLEKDPSESENVADRNPEMMSKLEKIMKSEHKYNPVFPFPVLDNH